MPRYVDPPVPVPFVLEAAIDALLGGSSGWFKIAAGGNMRCDWLTSKRCYRLTIDVAVADQLADQALVDATIAKLRADLSIEIERQRQRRPR